MHGNRGKSDNREGGRPAPSGPLLAVLDLGTSVRYGQPVLTLVTQRATTTVQAGLAALLLALLVGVPAGVLASRSASRFVRHGIAAVSILLLSVPALVVAEADGLARVVVRIRRAGHQAIGFEAIDELNLFPRHKRPAGFAEDSPGPAGLVP